MMSCCRWCRLPAKPMCRYLRDSRRKNRSRQRWPGARISLANPLRWKQRRIRMRRVTILVPVFLVLLLASCAKEESAPAASDAQHAKVDMRDGTSVSGNVVSSTASDITVAPDGGGANRTISMKQVKSVSYDDAPAAPAVA